MNIKIITYTLGMVLNFEGVCLLLPLLCSLIYKENYTSDYIMCIILCVAFGCALIFKRPEKKRMSAREGFLSVGFAWILMSIFGALPFVFTGYIPNFADALFETVSGFTTTGASILADVEALPKSLLFWRSFTHWIGGMGVLVFLVAILPLSDSDNFNLIKAESPGPSVGKLVPKIRSSAKILYIMYIVFTVIQVILMLCGGLNLFDSLTLTFGTAGTGGFSVLNSGISTYSPYIQYVITVFMILFGIDFTFYYLLVIKKARLAFKLTEVRTYIGIIIVAIALISFNCYHIYGSIEEVFRHSAFQVGSIITTTGYSTTDFNLWPEFSKTILVILMFIGACAGSTGGGIKVSRVIILIKSVIKQLRLTAHPKSTFKMTMNGKIIEHETVRAVNVYMAAYIFIFALSVLILSLDNFDFTTNFTAIAATINNIGPGLAGVGPMENFSAYSNLSKIVMIFDMLVGRLEIFPIIMLFSPHTWKK